MQLYFCITIKFEVDSYVIMRQEHDRPRGQDATIDIEYNKRLDRQRPCFQDELTAGSYLQYKVTNQFDAVVVVQYFVPVITSSLV